MSSVSYSADFYDNSTAAPHISLIQGATSSLDIEIYTMEDPLIQQAILDAQGRGVKVRIVQEPAPVGDACKIFNAASAKDPSGCDELRNFMSQVQAAGGQYVPYNKSAFCNGSKTCYEHGKMMIIDNATALVSSGNFDNTSICDTANGATRCNRDYSVVTQDSGEVQTLETIFQNDLAGESYDLQSLVDAIPSMTLTVSPYSLPPLEAFIQTAQTSIQLENQYLHDSDLNQALEAAASRGVNVQVMVASICSFGKPSNSEVNDVNSLASEFSSAGINARAFTSGIQVNGKPGYLHGKSIVVDGNAAWVGSVNGSTTALGVNREFGIFFTDANAVSQLASILTSDFNDPAGTDLASDANCTPDASSSGGSDSDSSLGYGWL
jgi:phosphatidylserine/phosphatidylglycerophosphate/cardiolipin synthase-like enzyme